jgi:hypothetical protein
MMTLKNIVFCHTVKAGYSGGYTYSISFSSEQSMKIDSMLDGFVYVA